MWIAPFVGHCLGYNDYWAQNPPFVLSILNVFCLTFMGAMDCAVFAIKERPWRHVKGNVHGTFSGSFRCLCCIARTKNKDGEAETPCQAIRHATADDTVKVTTSAIGAIGKLKGEITRPLKALTFSNRNGERMRAEAERARERLEKEMKDRREFSESSISEKEKTVPKSVRIQNALERVDSESTESDGAMSPATEGKPRGWTHV